MKSCTYYLRLKVVPPQDAQESGIPEIPGFVMGFSVSQMVPENPGNIMRFIHQALSVF